MNIYLQSTIRLIVMLTMTLPLLAQAAVCGNDADCNNGLFCDGVEVCAPGARGANVRGCVAGTPISCSAGQSCNEIQDECRITCYDRDGDDHDDAACGGDDCDDAVPTRYPGATEVCDGANFDEDCNGATFGDRDTDGDGFKDVGC